MDSRRWARGPLAGQRLRVELVSRTQGHRQEFTFCTEAEEGRKKCASMCNRISVSYTISKPLVENGIPRKE